MRLLAALCVALTAHAASATSISVEMSVHGCTQRIDLDEMLTILDLELRSNSQGDDIDLSLVTVLSDHGRAGVTASLECSTLGTDVTLTVEHRPSDARTATVVPLEDLPTHARSRTVALALAETIRILADVAKSSPPVVDGAASIKVPSRGFAPPRPMRRRMRLMRDVALSLAVVTCASVIVGAAITGVDHGHHDRHGPDADEAIAGVAFGIGGLALVGTSVDLGLWLRDRARGTSEVRVSDAAGPSILSLSF